MNTDKTEKTKSLIEIIESTYLMVSSFLTRFITVFCTISCLLFFGLMPFVDFSSIAHKPLLIGDMQATFDSLFMLSATGAFIDFTFNLFLHHLADSDEETLDRS